MEKVATLILNRNLPEVTDTLVEQLQTQNSGENDIYVIESGSEREKLSRYCTWWANWPDAMQEGLRFSRGFNFGLSKLWQENSFEKYDYFFLVCNDIAFTDDLLPILLTEMQTHPRVGILSPCCKNWGEYEWIGSGATRYAYHGTPLAWLVRKDFVSAVMDSEHADIMHFLFDGTNFRGDGVASELIAKGYINEWATAITTKATIIEKTEFLLTGFDLIRTDRVGTNERLMIAEGKVWMKHKYGFTNRLHMSLYVQMFYERFFVLYPHLSCFRMEN